MVSNFQLGLVGYPIDHSLSPLLHDIMLREAHFSGAYHSYAICPDANHECALASLIEKIRMGHLQGLNVTIPYKRTVMQYVDELTHEAKTIGAVNLIHMKQDRVIGDNSDARGFYNDLKKIGFHSPQPSHRKALILGAGGAARAVAFSLLKNNWLVNITSRRFKQAQDLSENLKSIGKVTCLSTSRESYVGDFDLIVNATPLGMAPHVKLNPWPKGVPYPSHANVYDLVYNPTETEMMKSARTAGLRVSNGMGMLIEQAAISFETWTGVSVQRKRLWHTVTIAMSKQNPSSPTDSFQHGHNLIY